MKAARALPAVAIVVALLIIFAGMVSPRLQ